MNGENHAADKGAQKAREAPVVNIDPGGMRAVLVLPPGYAGSLPEAMAALAAAGVVYGIEESAIGVAVEKAAKAHSPIEVVAAQGKAPVEAEDGRVDFKYLPPKKEAPAPESRESVDFHEVSTIAMAQKDQLLAVMVASKNGVDGCDVKGRILHPRKARGSPRRLSPGKNVRLEEANYLAECAGRVEVTQREIKIASQLVLPGDVDFASGNIRFPGDVHVKGGVKTGFLVDADDDVLIEGGVENAKIVSRKNITVRSGITGHGKSLISAAGSVTARFIENSVVEAGGDVVVHSHIFNSRVCAGGWVRVLKGKGAVVGGEIKAGKGVEVRFIGSDSVRGTTVSVVGSLAIEKQLSELEQNIGALNGKIARIKLELGDRLLRAFEADPEFAGKIHDAKARAAELLFKQMSALQQEAASLDEERESLTRAMRECTHGPIKALEKVFPGSVIHIGRAAHEVVAPLDRTMFAWDAESSKIKTSRI